MGCVHICTHLYQNSCAYRHLKRTLFDNDKNMIQLRFDIRLYADKLAFMRDRNLKFTIFLIRLLRIFRFLSIAWHLDIHRLIFGIDSGRQPCIDIRLNLRDTYDQYSRFPYSHMWNFQQYWNSLHRVDKPDHFVDTHRYHSSFCQLFCLVSKKFNLFKRTVILKGKKYNFLETLPIIARITYAIVATIIIDTSGWAPTSLYS